MRCVNNPDTTCDPITTAATSLFVFDSSQVTDYLTWVALFPKPVELNQANHSSHRGAGQEKDEVEHELEAVGENRQDEVVFSESLVDCN
jgi:hypothetical protein